MAVSTLEEIVSVAASLRPPNGSRRFARELVPGRVFIAIGPTEKIELFFKGGRTSFLGASGGRAFEWGEYQMEGSSIPLPALVVRTESGDTGLRLAAHVGYEACRILAEEESVTNAGLLDRLQPFLSLVIQSSLLSSNEQTGLMGELLFLHRLMISVPRDSDQKLAALNAWTGPDASRRDFFANGVAVEVKTSSSGSRHVVAFEQMLPDESDPEESLYLCSVRVRRDTSAPLRLPEQVNRIVEALDSKGLADLFFDRLRQYGSKGYEPSMAGRYEMESGFFVEEPVLRKIDRSTPVLRPESFREGEPPVNVFGLRYTLEVSGIKSLSVREFQQVLRGLTDQNSPG